MRQTQNIPEKTHQIQKTAFGQKLADQATDSLKKSSKTKIKQTNRVIKIEKQSLQ